MIKQILSHHKIGGDGSEWKQNTKKIDYFFIFTDKSCKIGLCDKWRLKRVISIRAQYKLIKCQR